MRSSTLSMLVYAVYLAGLAVAFLFIPNPVISLFGFAETTEVWIRILGYLLGVLAFFYLMALRDGLIPFYRWTVAARLPVLPLFALLVALGMAPLMLLSFGAVDLVCAIWTGFALRNERVAHAGRHV